MCLKAESSSLPVFVDVALIYSGPALIDRVRQLLWTLCLMSIVFTGESAYAEWVAVEKDYLDPGLRSIYIDPDTISREGPFATVWQLTDYKMMQGGVMSPPRFFSTKTLKQLDCERQRVRVLEYVEFPSHMGTGTASHGYVDQDAWLPIEPASVNHALSDVLCGQE
ncbi:MAG: hypothetical protein FJ244_00175 [Nitrospira sp.]|nr:hypothetical protein [Nitrospira sp.]